jgi:hypothetical protein
MKWLIPLIVIALAGVFLWVQYHRSGENLAEFLLHWWDGLRDRWANRGSEDRADIPPPAEAPPLPRPPVAAAPPVSVPGPAGGEAGVPDQTAQPVSMAQSDVLYAISALVAMASNGDIRAVRRVVKTLSAAAAGLGGGLARLSIRLAEPDKHYGGEIWEPLGTAGAQMAAAGLYCEQADSAMLALLASTVGELADSPRQAPHHSQLNGGN